MLGDVGKSPGCPRAGSPSASGTSFGPRGIHPGLSGCLTNGGMCPGWLSRVPRPRFRLRQSEHFAAAFLTATGAPVRATHGSPRLRGLPRPWLLTRRPFPEFVRRFLTFLLPVLTGSPRSLSDLDFHLKSIYGLSDHSQTGFSIRCSLFFENDESTQIYRLGCRLGATLYSFRAVAVSVYCAF